MNLTATHRPRRAGHTTAAAFSLVELLISMGVLSIMLLFFANMTGMVTDTWTRSESRVETYQNGRAALELMSREMTSAVVDTRMQFVVGPGDILRRKGEMNVAEGSHCALWMAPIGPDGDLRCVGYYLYRDETRDFYRLKRIYIASDNGFFPKIATFGPALSSVSFSVLTPVDATSAKWFTDQTLGAWSKELFDETNLIVDETNSGGGTRGGRVQSRAAVSTAADGVIALWFQCIDLLGNPIPWVSLDKHHPPAPSGQVPLHYNSAAYFTAATSTPFETDGGERSFLYMAETPLVTKANRVPAAVDITVVTIDERALVRRPVIPAQTNEMAKDGTGALDIEESIRVFKKALIDANITTARTFTTRVKLVNGS